MLRSNTREMLFDTGAKERNDLLRSLLLWHPEQSQPEIRSHAWASVNRSGSESDTRTKKQSYMGVQNMGIKGRRRPSDRQCSINTTVKSIQGKRVAQRLFK